MHNVHIYHEHLVQFCHTQENLLNREPNTTSKSNRSLTSSNMHVIVLMDWLDTCLCGALVQHWLETRDGIK